MRRSLLLFLRRTRFWWKTLFRSITTRPVNFLLTHEVVDLTVTPATINYLRDESTVDLTNAPENVNLLNDPTTVALD